MKKFQGIAAGPGIAIGKVFNFVRVDMADRIDRTPAGDAGSELALLKTAISQANDSLQELIDSMETAGRDEEVEVFSIQLEFLDDPGFAGEITSRVSEKSMRAAHALEVVSAELREEFSQLEDDYFRERIADIADLTQRLMGHILGIEQTTLAEVSEPSIILADDLTPTDTAHLDRNKTLALCTMMGSATSHTAILSRGLGIPAVVGLGSIELGDGTQLIVDGSQGVVLSQPETELLREYEEKASIYIEEQNRLRDAASGPATSKDGKTFEIAANIGTADDARQAIENGADGVGLFRTEFLFLERSTLPDEQEQYKAYREIFSVMGERPIVVRTLDVGGDKQLPSVDMPVEQNPFLGERAIRLALNHPEKLLLPQIRALLRAGEGFDLRIMFPMVASPKEFITLKEILEKEISRLESEGIAHNPKPQLGIMIEIPSAVVTADLFAPHLDFFSIGTNDLTQYTLAADRTNEVVAPIADYFEPAIIRLIDMLIQTAHKHRKWVGMCGEMAGDPAALPILLALGLDEYSMAPSSIPRIKGDVRKYSVSELADRRQEILSVSSAENMRKLFPG